MEQVTWWIALGAGFLSFISPCCLPLYPSYLSYITGMSVSQLKDSTRSREVQAATMLHALFFVIGFSLVFYALGFTVSWVGSLFKEYKDMVRMLSAILIVAMGLFMLGVFQPKFMLREKKWNVSKKGISYLGSAFVGVGFAAGWSPCIGPILASVLAMASLHPERAFIYITLYTLGFAIPFLVMAFFIGRTKWLLKYSNRLMKIGGAFMVLFGILLYLDQLSVIIVWLTELTGGFRGF
ncbi:cytochrome c biogenesis CcdA family protein [Thermoflavimicrobium dichotomicum]|uniref:Cytochrome c-type biogenesis protein n=1 Tax=Thermoflavimicrobium dichotomicum TaxID=46223 RepID=A0A1I3N981_9BACL|nr:cytochrome c biogenesis protein CcdA [Thermoflavimicrobium dichotomicum]SFJ05396.1 cytochrome c-type biogenesis protein [Thermoflavimicrobium dichotomicum]